MTKLSNRMAATLLALAALAVVAAAPTVSRAQGASVDPEAVKLLRRMTDYIGSLKQFSVHTQNTLEDLLDSGHRIDVDVSKFEAKSNVRKRGKFETFRISIFGFGVWAALACFGPCRFGFLICFGFRYSNFEFGSAKTNV